MQLSKEGAERLRREIPANERRYKGGGPPPPPSRPAATHVPSHKVALTGAGGITGRSGATMGSGTATLYDFTPPGTLDNPLVATVYNVARGAVAGSTYILVGDVDGYPFVVVEDCGP